MKTCSSCNKELPFTEYHKRKYPSGTVGYQTKCKKCSSEKRATYYKPHQYMRTKFKLTEEEYQNLMLIDYCEICNVKLNKKCIDHCHTKEKIRGVLCNNCNTALGLVGDSTEVLSKMISYINR